MPTRRSLLAAAAPLLCGGCLGDTPAADQSPTASPSETVERTSTRTDRPADNTSTPDCTRGYTVSLSPFAPTEQLVATLRPSQRRLFGRIVAEDGVALRTYGTAPIRAERYVAHEGAYYRVDYWESGIEEVPARRADVSWEKGQEAPDDATVIAYPDLPEADRVALDLLIRGPAYSREGLPTQGLSVSDAPAPYPQGTGDSMLVGAGTRWVEWDGRVYRVTVTTEATTLTRQTYNYSATRVADSAEAFRAFVADRYLTSLDDPSNEERAVLDAAKEAGESGEYEDCNEPSVGYETLKRRMERVPDLPEPHGGTWYVTYEGERYLLEIGGWVA